ncbi:MAG: DNA polymerase III subunit delta' [Planctomycetota bacterium]
MFFDEIIGQPSAVNIFEQVLASSRLSHAYIFSGPAGTGKLLFAKTLAKILMCEDKSGCNVCRSCKWVEKNCHPNLRITSVEKGSKEIKIQAVREIEQELMLTPFSKTHRVFIVNEAERMSEEAFNAFLKTLEEPVKDTVIILVTSNIAVLPRTVVSRCQVIRFHPIEQTLVTRYLEQWLKIKPEDALLLSHLSDGSIGDACKLYEDGLLAQRERLIKGLAGEEPGRLARDIANYAKSHSEDKEDERREIIWQLKIIGLFIRDALWLAQGLPDNKLLNKDRIPEVKQYQRRYNNRLERLMERLLKSERYIRLNANTSLVVESLLIA